jgi:hypothetical protein
MIETEQINPSNETQQTNLAQQYVEQPQQARPNNIYPELMDKYKNTPAGKYINVDELAKGYNSLVSYLGSKEGASAGTVAENIIYNGKYQDNQDIKNYYIEQAKETGLNQQQFDKYVENHEAFMDSYEEGEQEEAAATQARYWDSSLQYFGRDIEAIADAADFVIERKIPEYTNGEITTEQIMHFMDAHGIAAHPIMLTMLNMIYDAYTEGKAGVPGNLQAPGYYNNPEYSKIINDQYNPQRNDLLLALYNKYNR